MRVFENRVTGKRIGPKGDQLTGRWSRLHNKKLHGQVWKTGLMQSGFLVGLLTKETNLKTGHGWEGNIYGIW